MGALMAYISARGAAAGGVRGIPAKYSSIVSQLLASCEQSPFATQFLNNLMGPVFYELTMMAMPSEDLQSQKSSDGGENEVASSQVHLNTIVKFLCFVYMESALQYESTEDVFETLTFCDQFEVAELQEYCTASLKSVAENIHRRGVSQNRLLGKRICDYLVLFLGGRIPFYFNEAELTLLHSVLIETLLDLCYARRSEFDMAQEGILWVQRKLMIPQSKPIDSAILHPLVMVANNRLGPVAKKKNCHIAPLLILVNLLVICSGGVTVSSAVQYQCLLQLLVAGIWTWVVNQLRHQGQIVLLMHWTNAEALEGIIAGKQEPVSEIIHFETGS